MVIPDANTRQGGRTRTGNAEDGIALMTVLWVLLLLSTMAATLVAIAQTELGVVRNAVDNARVASIADAGIYHAIFGVLDARPNKELRTDGTASRLEFGGGELWISIQDEAGKVDINRAQDTLFRGLFEQVGIDGPRAHELVDRIADFRDQDSLVRLRGAEKDDYAALGLPHGPRNEPFQAIEEIQQVLGLTPEIFQSIEPFITVHSRHRSIDPASAPELVLRAAPNLSTAGVDELLVERAEMTDGTQSPSSLTTAQQRAGSRGAGGVYTVRATAILENKATFVREAIISLRRSTESPYRILRWKQSFDRRQSDTGEFLN